MFLKKYGSLTFLLLSSLCLLLLGACNAPQNYVPPITPTTHAPVPTPSTSCPAPGKGRAAIMPPLTLGRHQVVVYDTVRSNSQSKSNLSNTSSIGYYDISTKKTTTILTEANETIGGVQVSADGQWLLFVAQDLASSVDQNALQLVRLDGKYLQTLYCSVQNLATQFAVQWSSDQKQIAFSVYDSSRFSSRTYTLQLLDTRSSTIQTELSLPASSLPLTPVWLDATRLYLIGHQPDQPPTMLYMLDTAKGRNQHVSDLLTVVHHPFGDFASSSDARKLYLSTCICGIGGAVGPSSISVLAATGGQEQTIYSSAHDAITRIYSVQPTTLLFTVTTEPDAPNENSYPADDGLWKINTDGTGLTHLLTVAPKAIPFSFLFSHDGTMYTAETFSFTLVIGSMNGGAPTTIVTANSSDINLSVIGWTTM